MEESARVILASLLHDIGKFWQRTGQPYDASLSGFTEEDYGRHGAHALWSASFFQRFLPSEWRAAGAAALFHHKPRDYVTKLVTAADWMSSGERDDLDLHAGVQASQLRSLFSRLTLDDAAPAPAASFYPLAPLTLTEAAIFPRPGLLADAERRATYARLWNAFGEELARIPPGEFASGFETLYFLLQKYTWCVPSAFYRSVPDVSLFDHGRTTAAIAAALYRAGVTEAELDALLARDREAWQTKRLMLVGGDITGVQAFLYTITARGAARGLRGRSFYLQLLGEAIARWLLRRLELPITNLLYAGGGRFYLLTHLLPAEELAAIRRHLDLTLLRCHRGDLYVALGAVPLAGQDLQLGAGFGQLWAAVGRELNEQKRRKFAALPPEELYPGLFEPAGEGGESPGCIVCRREGPAEPGQPPEERKCTFCSSLERLGSDLRDAEYLYLGVVEPTLPEGQARGYADTLRALGVTLRLFGSRAELRRQAHELGRGTLLALKTTAFLDADTQAASRAAGGGLALGFSLLANVTPRRSDGGIAEFSDLARASRGVQRLGVLRMDVDDLGAIFSRGLGEAATLSRVANLSFLLRLYFEGWLAELARQHNQASEGSGQDHVYVIYSGGDDLFIVGSWDQLPSLALDIQRDFQRFTAGNPALHLSGGIAVVETEFPLYQAAEQAHEALERAKRREVNGRVVKNALDFLGQTTSWEELVIAQRQKNQLLELLEQDGAPRALLHLLARLHQLYLQACARPTRGGRAAGDQVPYGRWMWAAAYTVTRLAERAPRPAAARIHALRRTLLGSSALGPAPRTPVAKKKSPEGD